MRIEPLEDERAPLTDRALGLIEQAFHASERQPRQQIMMEVAEKRLGLLTLYDFHLLAGIDEAGEVVGVASGVYLGGVNTGFITYLAVHEAARGRQLGRDLRARLIAAFEKDAARGGWPWLAGVAGEVRLDSPWLARLHREREVLPLDLTYYHPGQHPGDPVRWVLYRQPVGDAREALPAAEVRQLLYAIWRRAYRVRWPLERDAFQAMLRELEGRETVAAHAEVGG